jgi:hypothetical protein
VSHRRHHILRPILALSLASLVSLSLFAATPVLAQQSAPIGVYTDERCTGAEELEAGVARVVGRSAAELIPTGAHITVWIFRREQRWQLRVRFQAASGEIA